jgi:arsenical pump membrane protein
MPTDLRAIAAAAAFAVSCVLTVLLMLHRPYLQVRVQRRHMRMPTYFLGALFGPVAILALGVLHLPDIAEHLRGTPLLNPGGILALFLSMAFISVFLDITGVFEACARWSLRHAGNDGRRLFLTLYATVAVLTIFTSNDIIILTFTPIVCHFARHARINPVPYLVAEFFAANTWSALLYVGNPTNILVASAFQLDFVEYAAWMALPTLASGLVNLLILYRIFRHEISKPLDVVPMASPLAALTDRPGAALGTALLAACIVGLAVAPRFGVELWVVAVASAAALLAVLVVRRSWARLLRMDLIREGGPGVRHTLGSMPWTIVPFVLSMFITVEALRRLGYTAAAGRALAALAGHSAAACVYVYGIGSALAANLLNNIPMTLAFTSMLKELGGGQPELAGALATAMGSNLGANLTPLGALAGLLWMSLLREKEIPIRFGRFLRYGLLATPASLLAGLTVLAIEMALA